MTRRDYVTLAASLRNARPWNYLPERVTQTAGAPLAWLACVYGISDALLKDNPNHFDAARFQAACGVGNE